MRVVYARCGGLDVHKRRVSACRIWEDEEGHPHFDSEEFGSWTKDLNRLADWMIEKAVVDVALESTGPYWRPVWNVLEARALHLTLANPEHIKAIPGHKTDRQDARWIAELHQHGLVPASFVPCAHQRELRDLTRMRTKVVQDRSRVITRIQAVLEDANIKLCSVARDVMGVSAQDMLRELLQGHDDPAELAELARGSLRRKRGELKLALEGHFTPHHGFLLERLLIQERALRNQENALDRRVARSLNEEEKAAIALWDTIPGVNQRVGEVLVAELGVRPEQFTDSSHAASWVAICPGNRMSAGKRLSGKIRKGNQWLRTALVEAAWAAARTKRTYLSALYAHLIRRKLSKQALVAVGHSILVAAYQMLKTGQTYRDAGPEFFDHLRPEQTINYLVRRITRLGFKAELTPIPS